MRILEVRLHHIWISLEESLSQKLSPQEPGLFSQEREFFPAGNEVESSSGKSVLLQILWIELQFQKLLL